MGTQPSQPDQARRMLAALAYPIWFVALLVVVTDLRKDPFLRHHGWTGLFWGPAWLLLWMITTLLAGIPFIGFPFGILSFGVLWLAWFLLSLYFAIQAYNSKMVRIPLVSDLAQRYSGAA